MSSSGCRAWVQQARLHLHRELQCSWKSSSGLSRTPKLQEHGMRIGMRIGKSSEGVLHKTFLPLQHCPLCLIVSRRTHLFKLSAPALPARPHSRNRWCPFLLIHYCTPPGSHECHLAVLIAFMGTAGAGAAWASSAL